MFPRYNMVYTDSTFTVVEKLIATNGDGKGFYLIDEPETVQALAHQFGEVSIHDLQPA